MFQVPGSMNTRKDQELNNPSENWGQKVSTIPTPFYRL